MAKSQVKVNSVGIWLLGCLRKINIFSQNNEPKIMEGMPFMLHFWDLTWDLMNFLKLQLGLSLRNFMSNEKLTLRIKHLNNKQNGHRSLGGGSTKTTVELAVPGAAATLELRCHYEDTASWQLPFMLTRVCMCYMYTFRLVNNVCGPRQ